MLSITFVCAGRLKEKYFTAAQDEYQRRIRPYAALEIIELPESRLDESSSPALVERALLDEASAMSLKIPATAFVIAMCVEGSPLSSMELSDVMESAALRGKSRICFVVGGSNGLHHTIKKRADLCLSMSAMTFPHHLARIMALEQVYRALNIKSGGKYHK